MIPKEPKRASESLHDQEEVSDIISLNRQQKWFNTLVWIMVMSLEVGRPLLSYTWLPPGGYQSSINIVTNNKQQLCTHLKENWNNHRYLDQNSSSNKSLGLQVSHHSHHKSLCEIK